MHVGVEKSVTQGMLQEILHGDAREIDPIDACRVDSREVGKLDAIHPIHRQHRAGRGRPIHLRHREFEVLRRVFSHFREGSGLEAQIHFEFDRAFQRVDHIDNAQAAGGGHKPFDEPRREGLRLDVLLENACDSRSQHLDRHGSSHAVLDDFRAMNLRNRGSRDRWAERGEDIRNRLAECR